MTKTFATGCVLLSLSAFGLANEMPKPGLTAADSLTTNAQGSAPQTLASALKQIQSRTGVEFILAPHLAEESVRTTDVEAGVETLPLLLGDYNYATRRADDGQLEKVIIIGRRDGSDFDLIFAGVPRMTGALPERLRDFPPGTVTPLEFNVSQLLHVPLGEKTALKLPSGYYAIVHDNLFEHPNGDKTWVGFVDGESSDYRMVVTVGAEGTIGQILTPEGLFRIEVADGHSWLVDVDSAGLETPSMEGDDLAMYEDGNTVTGAKRKRRSVRRKTAVSGMVGTSQPPAPSNAGAGPKRTTVDLMALYTPGFAGGAAKTRLNFLVAAANQAYIDSKVNINLRLVFSQAVNYATSTTNSAALNDITYGRSIFSGVESLRKRYGADLVTLLRPFDYKVQVNCGSAWVGGSNGSAFRGSLGYSAVSDGIDPMTRYYCTNYTLAHELGHNMGSTHDPAHSSVAGKYAFSYGHGQSGVFGTIMSYYNPQLGSFSNPANLCKGLPCGIANKADNARSLNLTAPAIAGFMPSVVP